MGAMSTDTATRCEGDMSGSFFRTHTQTDRNTQRTEIAATWNGRIRNIVETLKRLERRFPFPITSGHEDSGPESINCAMTEMLGRRKGIPISRSRFHRKNDNAHVGQTNETVVRGRFREPRPNRPDLGSS